MHINNQDHPLRKLRKVMQMKILQKKKILQINIFYCSEIDVAHFVRTHLNASNITTHQREILDRSISKANPLPKPISIAPYKGIDVG